MKKIRIRTIIYTIIVISIIIEIWAFITSFSKPPLIDLGYGIGGVGGLVISIAIYYITKAITKVIDEENKEDK